MSGIIPPGLIKFCIEHTDSEALTNDPPRLDERDVEFLQAAFESVEDDPKKIKRFLAVAADPEKNDVDSRVDALEEVEFLVEQIDNANDLVVLGGWPVLVKSLADENPPIRAAAARCIAAAVQNNASGLLEAVKRGAMVPIARAMQHPLSGGEADPAARKATLLAASAMCRGSSEVSDALVSRFDGIQSLLAEVAQGTPLSGAAARLLGHILVHTNERRGEARDIAVSMNGPAALARLAKLIGDCDGNTDTPEDESEPRAVQAREAAVRALIYLAVGDPTDDAAAKKFPHVPFAPEGATPCPSRAADVAAVPGIASGITSRTQSLSASEDQGVVEDELELLRELAAALNDVEATEDAVNRAR